MAKNSYNPEWEDSENSVALDSLTTIFIMALLVFIFVQLANEYNLGGQQIPLNNIWVSLIFLFLLWWGVSSHMSDEAKNQKNPSFLSRYCSFGKNLRNGFIGLFIGLVLGLIMNSSNLFTLALPTLAAGTVLSSVETRVWQGIWTVLVAPFVEEKVFAGSLPFQFQATLSRAMPPILAKIAAFLITGIFFAFMHLVIFTFNAEANQAITAGQLLWSAFLFRIVALVINDQLKTWLSSYGMHTMTNLIQYLKMVG